MIPVPSSVTQGIARRAVEIIKITAPKKTGKAVNQLIPAWQDGIVGVDVPESVSYLIDLDQGVNAKTMVNLAGKVIPIREADGTIAFRKVNASSVGRIPIVMRAAADGTISDGKPMWVRQAQPALSFIYDSIERSISEWEKTVKPDDVVTILQQTSLRESLNIILAGTQGIVGME